MNLIPTNGHVSFHTHSCFSDGKNTMEEMVEEAISLGFSQIGFTDHSFVSFDADCSMAYEAYAAYKEEVKRLNRLYGKQISVIPGIEQDYYSDYPANDFAYIIGSVHFIKARGEYIPVDYSGTRGALILKDAAAHIFDGDIYALAECYFATLADVVRKTGADIIGHFDVLRKTNEAFHLFDETHPRYVAAWQKAADALLLTKPIFEINVSAMLRKDSSHPYPHPDIQAYLQERGASFLYTGDCHSLTSLRAFSDYLQTQKNVLK